MVVLITVIVVIFAAFCVFSWYLARYAVHGARYTLQETFEDQCRQSAEVAALAKVQTSSYEVKNREGYVLHATLYPTEASADTVLPGTAEGDERRAAPRQDDGTVAAAERLPLGETGEKKQKAGAAESENNKYIIMVHGYTLNRNGELKYMPIYRRLGYNCIVYDHRGHGENAWKPCSFGIEEAKDLMAVIDDTYERYGKDIYLGLTGESLGAGTEITALQYHPDVKFLVNDCGFAEIVPVEQDGLSGLHLPRWLVYPASIMAKLVYGNSFTAARPIDALKDNHIPICFIHGDADTFITKDHSERMHAADPGYSELHIVHGAAHAQSINTDPEGYEKIVDRFVRGVESGTIR